MIFPLPGVVLFPGMLLPLHIFEPRYKQLLEFAVEENRPITMALIKPHQQDNLSVDPGIFAMATEGDVVHCETLNDGTYRIVLEGKQRTRLGRELPKRDMVRVFDGDIQKDRLRSEDLENLDKLVLVIRERVYTWIKQRLPESIQPSVFQRIDEAVTIGDRLDRIASQVIHTLTHRQALLETLDVFERARIIENLTRWAGTRGPFGHTTMN